MSHIRGKDTKPEMVVRRFLWAHGFRYRLHSKKLPGRPDIVLTRLKTLVFINGCFWHGHNTESLAGGEIADSLCCRIPHSNRQFWLDKINRNRQRDLKNELLLQAQGWRVITIWECELKPQTREATLDRLLRALSPKKQYDFDSPEIAIAAESGSAYHTPQDTHENTGG